MIMQIKYRDLHAYKYEIVSGITVSTGLYNPVDINTPFINYYTNGMLAVAKGYAWDGPSGPTWDTKNFMRASLFHDALYQLIRLGLIHPSCRKGVDGLLRRICIEDGMSKFRAWYVYCNVRIFGRFFLKKYKDDVVQIHYAPDQENKK